MCSCIECVGDRPEPREFEFVVTRNSEKERHVVLAETDECAFVDLLSRISGTGIEKIVLATVRG